MNKEELKLLEKIVNLPKELNIEIRGLILAEVVLREENQQLKKQLQQKEDIINKVKTKIKEIAYGGSEDYYMEEFKKVLEILDNTGDENDG